MPVGRLGTPEDVGAAILALMQPGTEFINGNTIDVSGVGNHEFDEGVAELLRMQDGGCHPVDGCYFADDPYAGADFQWLAANVVDEFDATPLPPYWIERFNNVKVGFIGMTLEATDTLVAAAGIGLTFGVLGWFQVSAAVGFFALAILVVAALATLALPGRADDFSWPREE